MALHSITNRIALVNRSLRANGGRNPSARVPATTHGHRWQPLSIIGLKASDGRRRQCIASGLRRQPDTLHGCPQPVDLVMTTQPWRYSTSGKQEQSLVINILSGGCRWFGGRLQPQMNKPIRIDNSVPYLLGAGMIRAWQFIIGLLPGDGWPANDGYLRRCRYLRCRP